MAEDTREIVYYKGKEYYVIRKGELTSDLQLVSSSSVGIIAMNENILTKEEYEFKRDNKPPGYINYTL